MSWEVGTEVALSHATEWEGSCHPTAAAVTSVGGVTSLTFPSQSLSCPVWYHTALCFCHSSVLGSKAGLSDEMKARLTSVILAQLRGTPRANPTFIFLSRKENLCSICMKRSTITITTHSCSAPSQPRVANWVELGNQVPAALAATDAIATLSGISLRLRD